MKFTIKFVGAVAAGLVATFGVAFAAPGFNVPEPGSLALLTVALTGLVATQRRKAR